MIADAMGGSDNLEVIALMSDGYVRPFAYTSRALRSDAFNAAALIDRPRRPMVVATIEDLVLTANGSRTRLIRTSTNCFTNKVGAVI